jgi:hypothetical protein
MSSIIDDVAKIDQIMTVFTLLVVLGYPPLSVIVGQMSVATGLGCCFTSGALCLIHRPVTNRALALMVSS